MPRRKRMQRRLEPSVSAVKCGNCLTGQSTLKWQAKDWLVNRSTKSEDESLSGFQQIRPWKIRVSPAGCTSY